MWFLKCVRGLFSPVGHAWGHIQTEPGIFMRCLNHLTSFLTMQRGLNVFQNHWALFNIDEPPSDLNLITVPLCLQSRSLCHCSKRVTAGEDLNEDWLINWEFLALTSARHTRTKPARPWLLINLPIFCTITLQNLTWAAPLVPAAPSTEQSTFFPASQSASDIFTEHRRSQSQWSQTGNMTCNKRRSHQRSTFSALLKL